MAPIPLPARLAFLLLSLAALGQAAFAQSIDEVLARHTAARGGISALREVTSMVSRGTMRMMGTEFPITITQKRPRALRTEYALAGRPIVEATDGKTGWQVNPMTGSQAPKDMTGEELENLLEQADLDGPLVDTRAKGWTPELLGREEEGGIACFHIRLRKATGRVRDFYIDAGSYLLVRQKDTLLVRDKKVEAVTVFGDFRRAGGLLVPFRQGVTGPMPQEIRLDTILVGVAVHDSLFRRPR